MNNEGQQTTVSSRLYSAPMGAFRTSVLLLAYWCAAVAHADSAGASDAQRYLDQLSSGSATEREAAERWLGLHLTVEDYPALAAGVRGGDAETARRLGMALASESRHLGLVLLLIEEKNGALAAIGQSSFEEFVSRWCPNAGQRPVPARKVERALEEQMAQSFRYRSGAETLELHGERLDRHGQLGVPLVIDPPVASLLIETGEIRGLGLDLLRDLVKNNRLSYIGIGDWEGDSPGPGAWVLVGETVAGSHRSGSERLLVWLQAVQRGGTAGAFAARALGRSGWPAALEWLDRRWTEQRDSNALEGLLAAASVGRASREMLRTETRKRLLTLADAALSEASVASSNLRDPLQARTARRKAERILRALIGAGGAGLDGEELSSHWISGWEELNDAQRWMRFALLEGQRSGGTAVREFLMGELQGPRQLSDATRFQGLRALAAMPAPKGESLTLSAAGSLVSWALPRGLGPELARLLHSLGVPGTQLTLPADWSSRMFLLNLACEEGDRDSAVKHCLQLGEGAPERTLSAWEDQLEELRLRVGPHWLRAVAETVLKEARMWPPQQLARLERAFLVSGVLALPVDNRGWLRDAVPEAMSSADFARLGAWAGTPSGSLESQFLIRAVHSPPSAAVTRAALVEAVSRAVRRLRELHEDELADQLRESVWQASAAPNSPLHNALNPARWPGPNPAVLIDLVDLERLAP